jgi:hypothetical protein
MSKLFDRAKWVNTWTSLVDRAVHWGPYLFGLIISGGTAGWTARANSILGTYAPFSWVACALLGALVWTMICYFWAGIKERDTRRHLFSNYMEIPKSINPLEKTFAGVRVSISDFEAPSLDEPHKDITFSKCEIFGPAVVQFKGNVAFGGNDLSKCDIVKIKSSATIKNVITFENPRVTDCKLYRLTILVPEERKPDIPASANWITE